MHLEFLAGIYIISKEYRLIVVCERVLNCQPQVDLNQQTILLKQSWKAQNLSKLEIIKLA